MMFLCLSKCVKRSISNCAFRKFYFVCLSACFISQRIHVSRVVLQLFLEFVFVSNCTSMQTVSVATRNFPFHIQFSILHSIFHFAYSFPFHIQFSFSHTIFHFNTIFHFTFNFLFHIQFYISHTVFHFSYNFPFHITFSSSH